MNQVLEIIKNRRSIRKFKPEQIQPEELDKIIEAAIYAPTARNDQPWHFTIIQNKELMDYINLEAKKEMAKSPVDWMAKLGKNEKLNIFHDAPTVIIVSGRKDAVSPLVDCSAAIQNMLIAAESMEIGSCWIGLARHFFIKPKNVEKLDLPRGYEPYYGVSLGYKASYNNRAPERNKNVTNYIK
ncbi:MAG: nitroreductase family protein [Methanobacteriaceae archaeon]